MIKNFHKMIKDDQNSQKQKKEVKILFHPVTGNKTEIKGR